MTGGDSCINDIEIPSPDVDIDRYMGDWFVIGSIASPLERGAFNAVENYALAEDGTVKTTFSYRKNGFDGRKKTVRAKGFIKDEFTHAVWGMQFVWPVKADYRIAWISPDYAQVVIARQKRDYVWIMARTPQVAPEEYERLIDVAESLGYDGTLIKRVPQDGRHPWGRRLFRFFHVDTNEHTSARFWRQRELAVACAPIASPQDVYAEIRL